MLTAVSSARARCAAQFRKSSLKCAPRGGPRSYRRLPPRTYGKVVVLRTCPGTRNQRFVTSVVPDPPPPILACPVPRHRNYSSACGLYRPVQT